VTCKCPPTSHTFTVGSSTADLFSIAQWPRGTQTFEAATGCSVQIANPTGGIDLFSAGSSFAVAQVQGFSACVGTGGEDGDGCQPVSCPPLGIGSCSSARPRCSVGNNGSASATYGVQCSP